MDTANALALASAVSAALVAICVSWLAFRFALRQEQVRWLREQRTQLYVELLAEANSQVAWARMTRAELIDESIDDPRLGSRDRGLLFARAHVLASDAVVELWGRAQFDEWAHLIDGEPEQGSNEPELLLTYLELITAIRSELGTDRISIQPAQR